MMRIALVGYDHVHLPKYEAAIAEHPRAEVSHVVATGANKPLAKEAAHRRGAPYVEGLGALLEDLPDAAYLGTPAHEHLPMVEALAPRGVHILCDKPIAPTLREADAIIELCREHDVALMVPFNPRHQVPVQRLKAMLDGGELGELQHLHATKYGRVPRGIPGFDTSWFFDPAQSGFGGFGDIGIHAIDALRWLAGSEAARVHARIDRSLHPELPCDDLGNAVIEFRNGVLATLQAGWANPAGSPTWLSVSFEALGTAGAVLVDKPYQDLELSDGQRTDAIAWWRRDVHGLVNEFVEAVEHGRAPAPSGEDARAALEITVAAYRSAGTGAPVELPLTSP